MSTKPYRAYLTRSIDGHTICILPTPTGTQPNQVTLGTGHHTTKVRSVYQDSLGRYYIYTPHINDSCYLGIHYTKELGRQLDTPDPISSVECYTDYHLQLPLTIQQHITTPSLTRAQKLQKLCRLFKQMTYDISPMIAQSYEGLKGENRVNQFLQIQCGGCQEAARAFCRYCFRSFRVHYSLSIRPS